MAKKTLGYLELRWTCPNCSGLNPGPEKTCLQCGAPQPEDVEFEEVKGQVLVQDEGVKARVAAGPDIHCPYCGTRNPGDAPACSQCGGDLLTGGRRESGKVLGAYQPEPLGMLPCPHCGAENLENARTCTQCGGSLHTPEKDHQAPEPARETPSRPVQARRLPLGLILLLVGMCIAALAFIFFAMRTEALSGTVAALRWERAISIEGLVPVEYRDWRDQIPTGAEILACQSQVRWVESEPQPDADEVCGTPYNVDTGSGYAEVVQDCEYHVYDETCTYSVTEWAVVDTVSLSGTDLYAEWPQPLLSGDQRQGPQSETYQVSFSTDQGNYTYSLNDYLSFQQFQIGSRWNLEVNSFGNVVSAEP